MPAPFGPMSACTEPGATVSETSDSARHTTEAHAQPLHHEARAFAASPRSGRRSHVGPQAHRTQVAARAPRRSRPAGRPARAAPRGRPPARRPRRPPPAPSPRSAPPAPRPCRHGGSQRSPRRCARTMRGARPSDGSSSSSTRGEAISARAIASICCSPPESRPARWPASLAQQREQVVHPVPGLPPRGGSRGQPARAQVLLHRQVLEDLAALGHLHHTGPDDGRRIHAVQPPPVELHRPGDDATTGEAAASRRWPAAACSCPHRWRLAPRPRPRAARRGKRRAAPAARPRTTRAGRARAATVPFGRGLSRRDAVTSASPPGVDGHPISCDIAIASRQGYEEYWSRWQDNEMVDRVSDLDDRDLTIGDPQVGRRWTSSGRCRARTRARPAGPERPRVPADPARRLRARPGRRRLDPHRRGGARPRRLRGEGGPAGAHPHGQRRPAQPAPRRAPHPLAPHPGRARRADRGQEPALRRRARKRTGTATGSSCSPPCRRATATCATGCAPPELGRIRLARAGRVAQPAPVPRGRGPPGAELARRARSRAPCCTPAWTTPKNASASSPRPGTWPTSTASTGRSSTASPPCEPGLARTGPGRADPPRSTSGAGSCSPTPACHRTCCLHNGAASRPAGSCSTVTPAGSRWPARGGRATKRARLWTEMEG